MSDEQPSYAPGLHCFFAPLIPTPGEEVWRLRQERRTLTCELRHDARAGVTWDVQLLEDGELRFARRCATEDGARFVAVCFQQDYLRAGWT